VEVVEVLIQVFQDLMVDLVGVLVETPDLIMVPELQIKDIVVDLLVVELLVEEVVPVRPVLMHQVQLLVDVVEMALHQVLLEHQ
jgi:hypothetical protein